MTLTETFIAKCQQAARNEMDLWTVTHPGGEVQFPDRAGAMCEAAHLRNRYGFGQVWYRNREVATFTKPLTKAA